jgi:hypothetical protein
MESPARAIFVPWKQRRDLLDLAHRNQIREIACSGLVWQS